MLTCAHVVAKALGISDDVIKEKPQGTVNLDFPFLDDAPSRTANVEGWHPPTGPSTNPSGDIAVLRFTTDPPDNARPARLSTAKELFGHEFCAYGFPRRHDPGVWAYGVLCNRLGNGWLQVEDTKEPGKSIQPGFSGGPVQDQKTGGVVGMVVMAATEDKVGFVIPTKMLARACPNLPIEHRAPPTNTPPPLPPNFVPRPEEINKLRQAIIGDQSTGPVALTALHGMGGIGKTELAKELCHDEDVEANFQDGTVWVHIGQDPGNLAGKMWLIGDALGDGPGHYKNPEAGAARLRTLLEDKAVLLVLDDVWDARYVEPFLINAPRCRTMFTTRNVDTALGLGALEVKLGVLEPEQAVALLRGWAGRDDPDLPEIAERLGYLPMAMKLAGTQLRREDVSGEEWLKTFQSVSQLKLGRYSDDPQENLNICFDLSVRQLRPEDQQLYYALGVFPEDVRIPQGAVCRLWQQLSPELSQDSCRQLVTELKQRSLIEWNTDDKTVILHDLLRGYTREQLGDKLPETHAALLSAYNPDGKPWPWIEHDGYLYYHLAYHLREAGRTEELYELLTGSPDWMEAKFVACTGDAAYVADLDLAIADFTDPLSDLDKVLTIAKLHTARQVVNARVSSYTNTDLQTLVWLGRENEALAHARLRNQAEDKCRGLLAVYNTLKERDQPNLFLLHEAREAARAIKDDRWRAEALSPVAVALAQAERYEEAGEIANSIGDNRLQSWELNRLRSEALRALAVALAQAGYEGQANEAFDKAREAADAIGGDRDRSEELGALAAALAQAERYEAAREVAGIIEDDGWRSMALRNLAVALAQAGYEGQADEVFDEARETADVTGGDMEQWTGLMPGSLVLSELASALVRAERYDKAREVADAIEDDGLRSEALSSLAAALVQAGYEGQADEMFDEARETADIIWEDMQQSVVLRALAVALAQAERYDKARGAADAIGRDMRRSEALSSVAVALTRAGYEGQADEVFDKAREAANATGGDRDRSEALRALAVALAQAGYEGQADEAFDEARGTASTNEDDGWRPWALRGLAAALARVGDESRANEVFKEVREAARTMAADGRARSSVLLSVASALAQAGYEGQADEAFDEAREAANATDDTEVERLEALRPVATSLTRAGRYDKAREVASMIGSIGSDLLRSEALSSLAAALAQAGYDGQANGVFDEAREVADAIKGDIHRSEALKDLATALARAGRYEKARGVADAIGRDMRRSEALRDLATALVQAERYDKAREVAGIIEDDGWRVKTLSSVAVALAQAGYEGQANEAFDEAREIAGTIENDWGWAAAWRALVVALAQARRFNHALAVLGLCELDEFLQTLAEWAPSFEEVTPGLSVDVLREATGLAGWVRSDWRRIHELLNP